jgi:hypothetical protein
MGMRSALTVARIVRSSIWRTDTPVGVSFFLTTNWNSENTSSAYGVYSKIVNCRHLCHINDEAILVAICLVAVDGAGDNVLDTEPTPRLEVLGSRKNPKWVILTYLNLVCLVATLSVASCWTISIRKIIRPAVTTSELSFGAVLCDPLVGMLLIAASLLIFVVRNTRNSNQ